MWSPDELTAGMREQFREYLKANGFPVIEDDEGFDVQGEPFGITNDAEAAAFMESDEARKMVDFPGWEDIQASDLF